MKRHDVLDLVLIDVLEDVIDGHDALPIDPDRFLAVFLSEIIEP